MSELRRFQKSSGKMNLDSLDIALHERMLNAISTTDSRYLRDSRRNCSMARLNTRFVSNVTVGYCMKRTSNKHRLCPYPYVLPVRHRTKSENSDPTSSDIGDTSSDFSYSFLEPSTSGCSKDLSKCPAKRCQSLENINLLVDVPQKKEPSPELECVSTQIQKLHVDE